MILEALLAYLHFAAILALVVFMTSSAALCRPAWLNAAVVRRLARVDRICWIAFATVLASGAARMTWGVKGWTWYASQPLMMLKLALFAAIAALMWPASRRFRAWPEQFDATGELPSAADIDAARRAVMVAAHLLVLLPLAAVLVARGVATV